VGEGVGAGDHPVIVYHQTLAAEIILSDGFRDGEGIHMTRYAKQGVWVFDKPPKEISEGPGDQWLAVDVPESELADFEWVEDGRTSYREWLVPADILNRYPVSMASGAIATTWRRLLLPTIDATVSEPEDELPPGWHGLKAWIGPKGSRQRKKRQETILAIVGAIITVGTIVIIAVFHLTNGQ
jgi:hypothetical protein